MSHASHIVSTFNTPMGQLEVVHDEHFIYQSYFSNNSGLENTHPLSKHIQSELEAYFANPKHQFNLQYKPSGTAYQLKVWNALAQIPSGQTLSYGDVAHLLHSAPRAIGQACKRNPIALFIPCHRVVSANGIGGYMGSSAASTYKTFLLKHEGISF